MQDFLAILMVLVAAAFLARRMWHALMQRRSGCGACSSCPSNSEAKAPTLVNIAMIESHAKAQRREDFGI